VPPGREFRVTSHLFACHTGAAPDQVWRELTDAGRTKDHLYGLALRSEWQDGASITADCNGSSCLTGEVICAIPGERLSYLLRSGVADPATYVTWVIRKGSIGTTISLHIDEPETSGSREDAEDTWLPVLDALQNQLRGPMDTQGR